MSKPLQSAAVRLCPLRKVSRKGELYERSSNIEAKLLALATLARSDLLRLVHVSDKAHPEYVPTECLLYFVRASRGEPACREIDSLYEVLLERVIATLPAGDQSRRGSIKLSDAEIREGVMDHFVGLLARDRTDYEPDLDYYEVRFNHALKALRIDVQDKAWRQEKKFESLTWDETTGELSPKVENAAGTFDPFQVKEKCGEDYRLRLNEAINTLPALQRTIIEMLRQGFPIESKDPNQRTLAKTVGKTEKTVRNQRDKAFAAVKLLLGREEAK